MTEDTVKVDGEDYIFHPDKVEKLEKQTEEPDHGNQAVDDKSEDEDTDARQSKLEQRKQRLDEDKKDKGKMIWTGGKIQ